MDPDDIVDAEWRELPPKPAPALDHNVPDAIRDRARFAQAVALRSLSNRLRRQSRTVSAPAPRLRPIGPRYAQDVYWQAACGGSYSERARAAEHIAVTDFISRPPRPHPRLRSI